MSRSTTTFEIGVIGAGTIASSTHLPVLANEDWADIGFVADVDRTQVKRLARSYRTEGVVVDDASDLPQCDIALLATPVGVREPYVEELGQRGTPVFSEKPFATDADTHRRYEEQLNAVTCNYIRLCFGATRQLRSIVASGVFGDVERVVATEGGIAGATGRGQDDYQMDDDETRSGMLLERGCHVLSQILSVLDPGEVEVDGVDLVTDGSYDVDVQANLTAWGDHEVPVRFELSRVRGIDSRLRIEFERATVSVDIDAPDGQVRVEGPDLELDAETNDRWATTFSQAAALRWRQFLSTLGANSDYPQQMATGPEITRLIDEMYADAEVSEL